MNGPRVVLADDHALLLGAFEKLLAGECQIVGQVSDGRALVAAAEQLRPDVIVLDISMPLLNGLEAGRQVKQMLRDVKLVFLTMNEDADLAAEAFRAGASGYLLKRSAASELATAIHEVMRGGTYITPLMAKGLVGSLLQPAGERQGHELTPRQREVLQLLA
jgi:DNA-binding NarL/FixJ family response regulator